jgi:hypothetical protein
MQEQIEVDSLPPVADVPPPMYSPAPTISRQYSVPSLAIPTLASNPALGATSNSNPKLNPPPPAVRPAVVGPPPAMVGPPPVMVRPPAAMVAPPAAMNMNPRPPAATTKYPPPPAASSGKYPPPPPAM